MSSAVPLWNNTVSRVVVVEMRRPTFLLITTHSDSRIYKSHTKTVKPPHPQDQHLSFSKTHRQQSLDVFLKKRSDVLPVQDVPQPAVVPLKQLLPTKAAGLGHILQVKVLVIGSLNARLRVEKIKKSLATFTNQEW